jgi:hypothetical protein
VSKMVKLLILVAAVLPAMLLAQAAPATPATPAAPAKGDKPYANGDVVKDYGTVTATFSKVELSLPGFTLKRVVTSEPTDTTFYYKENASFWTWGEGYVVTAPATGKDLGFFTYRPPTPAKPTLGKIYKATPPSAPAAAPKPAPTGWKRGVESVRSK